MKLLRCDHCGKEVEIGGVGVGTWSVKPENRFTISHEKLEPRDFCSLKCLSGWAAKHEDEDLS